MKFDNQPILFTDMIALYPFSVKPLISYIKIHTRQMLYQSSVITDVNNLLSQTREHKKLRNNKISLQNPKFLFA